MTTNSSTDTDYTDDYYFMNQTLCGLNKNITSGWCPEVFDNYSCWPSTPPGTVANISCPKILFHNSSGLAFKQCLENGSWYINEGNIAWSNYTQCVDMEYLDFLMLINRLNVIGYSISLVALVVSLWIFLRFKSLRCIRIKIHIQLFTSFILNNIMWIVWYEKIIPEVEITLNNSLWCQVFHVIKEYFMVANYMWMFCEALHLHLALVVVFVREERTMKWFYAVGWGMPFAIVLVHSLVRIKITQDTGWCWIYENTFATWFLSIPVVITLALSMIFLINILRVLLTIMHPNSPNPAPIGIRRAVRAALILTPLFGLQFVFIPVRPDAGHPLYYTYMYTTVIIIPFQGLCCAILFCFANHDVHQAIKRSFQRNVVSRQSIRQSTRWSNYPADSADDITNARNGQFSEDTKFKCYVKCLMAQMAVIEEDGDMDPEALIAVLPEEMQAALKPTVDKCVAEGMKSKPDACAVAWGTFKCYYNTDSQCLSEEMQALAKQLHNTCVAETGVKEELIDKVNKEKVFEDDENLKCYIKCLMSEMACVDDDGTIDEDATLAVLPEELQAKAEPVIKKCGTKVGSTPCETVWLTNKCYAESIDDYMLV